MSSRVEFGQDTGQFFQRFTLIEQIGVGGFATVHRGLDRLSNEFVAVKVVGLQNLPNREAYSSFQEVDKTQYFPSDSSLEREVYILSEASRLL